MAGPTDCSEARNTEIAKLKEEYGKQCKVIKDIGDFSHVVEVKLGDLDCAVKFQLEGDYPEAAPHVIVKCNKLSAELRDEVTLKLTSKASHLKGKPMLQELVNIAKLWVEGHKGLEVSLEHKSPRPQRSPQSARKNKKNARRNKMKSEDEVWKNEKIPPMRTAMDVVSRILWDDSLPQLSFRIGYIDRHLGLIEKNFTAFSWEDISTVDYNTLAIPKHRIQYFKFKDIKVWEKKTRLDNVFGSTGSGLTIYDVIEKYKQDMAQVAPSTSTHHNEYTDSDSDSEDDDVEINLGNSGSDFGDTSEDWDEEEETDDLTRREQYWGKKNRPTHFLCLRITESEVKERIAATHPSINEIDSQYSDCLMPPERLHVTLACLGLDTPEQVQAAGEVLEEIKPEIESNWNPSAMTLQMTTGVDHFYHNCIYAKITCEPKFLDFVDNVRSCFTEKGVEIRDVFDFNPHMTIIKMKKKHGYEFRTRYLDTARLFALLGDEKFGTQAVNNIYLCEMSENRQSDGFYVTQSHISFQK